MKLVVRRLSVREGQWFMDCSYFFEPDDIYYDKYHVEQLDENGLPTGIWVDTAFLSETYKFAVSVTISEARANLILHYQNTKKAVVKIEQAKSYIEWEYKEYA